MKFGCLYVQCTDNIGDDIQTFAQTCFLPRIDYFVERELLSVFKSKDHEKVALIMNAWYFNQPLLAWPPSIDILPLMVSMHFTPKLYDYFCASDYSREYLLKYGPVGCRDTQTMNKMEKLNIPCFFTGCLTLTLPKFDDIKKGDYICLVNVSSKVEEFIANTGLPYKIVSQQDLKLFEKGIKTRIENAKSILRIYQEAKCVITSRLHCALPCLALETPVIVEYRDEFEDRFAGVGDFLRLVTAEDICQGFYNEFLRNPTENKPDYKIYRDNLIKSCTKFIESIKYTKLAVEDITVDDQKRYNYFVSRIKDLYKYNRPFWENWYDGEDINNMQLNLKMAWDYVKAYENQTANKEKTIEELKSIALDAKVALENVKHESDGYKIELEVLAKKLDEISNELIIEQNKTQQILCSKSWKIISFICRFKFW